MGLVPPRLIKPFSPEFNQLGYNEQLDIINNHAEPIVSPLTGEPFDPSWIQWNKELLKAHSRLYKPEPMYNQLFAELSLSVGQLILSIWEGMVSFISGFYTNLAAFIFPKPEPLFLSPSDELQALSDALTLMARASKIDLIAKHEEIESYIPQPEYEDMLLAPADWGSNEL